MFRGSWAGVESIVDTATREQFFMEMNTRLQVRAPHN